MNIKMLVGLSGPEYSLSPGDVRDFPAKEAKRLIAAGFATKLSGSADPTDDEGSSPADETAIEPANETPGAEALVEAAIEAPFEEKRG